MTALTSFALAALLQVGGLSGDGDSESPSTGVASPRPAAEAPVHDGAARELTVANPWLAEGALELDGRLDDALWSAAPVLTGFTQFEPLEAVAASQRTDVRVRVTDEAVFFAIEAFDDQPGGIRGTLTERDGYGRSDDYVQVVLDTFNDQRRAFVFRVNPLGVQADGLWIEGRSAGGPVDWSPDFVWKSSGRMLDDRYVVELEIPFKSLRFPSSPVQDWGLQVTRRIQRNGYQSSWAPVTRNQANRLAQSGRLSGLQDLDPGLFMEINPVVTGNRSGAWDSDLDAFQQSAATGDVGVNLTYGLTSNLTLDGTVNPDFSQVEADAGQITVNERFALFLPEARPFFLEGTDVFNTPTRLVYTRSVANPVGAAKLSGKIGTTNVAYLGAVDQVSSTGDNPIVNLLRVRRDVGESSAVGLVYTDRTTPGTAFNRVLGADARFVLGGRYTVELQAAGSADGETGLDTEFGSLLNARFERSGRNFELRGEFEDIDDAFRARSGFIRRLGVTQGRLETGYTWQGGRGALLEEFGPSIELESLWTRDEFWGGRGPLETQLELGFRASLRGNVGTFVSYSRSGFAPDPSSYDGLFLSADDGTAGPAFAPDAARFGGLSEFRIRSWLRSWQRVRLSGGASIGETPIFERALGLPADLGSRWSAELEMNLYPTGSLGVELGARHVSIRRERDGSLYSSATIPRIETRYQFTRALFARFIGEYASQERGDIRDPDTGQPVTFCGDEGCALQSGSGQHDFSVEALVGYEPTPGTVVFAGYTRQMRDPVGFRFQGLQTRSEGLFVKLSYRFRM